MTDELEPDPVDHRQDEQEMREKILRISFGGCGTRGYSRGTLHQRKKNARGGMLSAMDEHVRKRIEEWG